MFKNTIIKNFHQDCWGNLFFNPKITDLSYFLFLMLFVSKNVSSFYSLKNYKNFKRYFFYHSQFVWRKFYIESYWMSQTNKVASYRIKGYCVKFFFLRDFSRKVNFYKKQLIGLSKFQNKNNYHSHSNNNNNTNKKDNYNRSNNNANKKNNYKRSIKNAKFSNSNTDLDLISKINPDLIKTKFIRDGFKKLQNRSVSVKRKRKRKFNKQQNLNYSKDYLSFLIKKGFISNLLKRRKIFQSFFFYSIKNKNNKIFTFKSNFITKKIINKLLKSKFINKKMINSNKLNRKILYSISTNNFNVQNIYFNRIKFIKSFFFLSNFFLFKIKLFQFFSQTFKFNNKLQKYFNKFNSFKKLIKKKNKINFVFEFKYKNRQQYLYYCFFNKLLNIINKDKKSLMFKHKHINYKFLKKAKKKKRNKSFFINNKVKILNFFNIGFVFSDPRLKLVSFNFINFLNYYFFVRDYYLNTFKYIFKIWEDFVSFLLLILYKSNIFNKGNHFVNFNFILKLFRLLLLNKNFFIVFIKFILNKTNLNSNFINLICSNFNNILFLYSKNNLFNLLFMKNYYYYFYKFKLLNNNNNFLNLSPELVYNDNGDKFNEILGWFYNLLYLVFKTFVSNFLISLFLFYIEILPIFFGFSLNLKKGKFEFKRNLFFNNKYLIFYSLSKKTTFNYRFKNIKFKFNLCFYFRRSKIHSFFTSPIKSFFVPYSSYFRLIFENNFLQKRHFFIDSMVDSSRSYRRNVFDKARRLNNVQLKGFKLFFYQQKLFKLFYGNLKDSKLKKLLKTTKLSSNLRFSQFISNFEFKLDVLLYRSSFFLSVVESRDFIKKGFVFVNNICVTNPDTILTFRDLISFKKSVKKYILVKLLLRLNSLRFSLKVPDYIYVNYKNLYIVPLEFKITSKVKYFYDFIIFFLDKKFLDKRFIPFNSFSIYNKFIY